MRNLSEYRYVSDQSAFLASQMVMNTSGYAKVGFLIWDNLVLTISFITILVSLLVLPSLIGPTGVKVGLFFGLSFLVLSLHPSLSPLFRKLLLKLADLKMDEHSTDRIKNEKLARFYHEL
ncbi:hypothetical protein [Marinomonas sp. 2405UD68-3]|uniref:hypothetical protein n=1 Tax=Marinomonas sp. 2405UD68-3 TaxID=3391835 RepID=UPI0039C95466